MSSVVIAGDVSGTCTLQAANAAGTTVLSLPTTSGTLVATGGAPSFTTVTTGLGNASAPSITFTGDTNTGIFSPTADTIAFTEGGTESMRIDSSGNVIIGAASNTYGGNFGLFSSGNTRLDIATTGATSQQILSFGQNGTARWQLISDLAASGSGDFDFVQPGTGSRMRIASTGLVSTTGSISSGGYVIGAGYYRSSGMVNETVTVTTEATVYSMNKDSGGGGSSSTSTYNITGLSNTDGSSAIIYVRNSNTAGGVNTVTIVQIHGTKVWEGNVQNTTKTASFGVFRQNGAWQTTAWSVGGVLNNVW